MSKQNEITDEEFVPFLHSLGVETYKKSFEWMLGDPTFAGVFTWLYNNLDHNNALTAREECRYAELKKANKLLSEEDLEVTIASIQQEFPGICLPSDREGLEDVKFDINMQKERLHALERQERVTNDLIKKNELIKEQLTIEITKLNAAKQQYEDDESAAAAECLTLAGQEQTLTEGVVDVIADTLDVYARCHVDKDISSRFIAFGPLEAYRQSQALYRSHFDLYTTRKFTSRQDSCTDEDLRSVIADAKSLEENLSNAAFAFIESKADLCGEQAKLELVTNYTVSHASQITALLLSAQSSLSLASQEECILEQQLRPAVQDLVSGRTGLALHSATASALARREQIHSDLSHLLSTSTLALSLDRALYSALRRELRSVQLAAQFAAQLAQHTRAEEAAVKSRLNSMNEIISAQETAMENLKQSDFLLQILCSIMGVATTDHEGVLLKFNELAAQLKLAKENLKQGYKCKEEAILQFKASHQCLREYVFSGCTRQPRGTDRTAVSLAHSLNQKLDDAEKNVLDLGAKLINVKNEDKRNMRKLWQWFLTDPSRLLASIKFPTSFS